MAVAAANVLDRSDLSDRFGVAPFVKRAMPQ